MELEQPRTTVVLTYCGLSEKVVEGFKLIGDVVAISSNLLAKRLDVEVGWKLEIIARCRHSAHFAHAELGRTPLVPVLSLPCEAPQLHRQHGHHH